MQAAPLLGVPNGRTVVFAIKRRSIKRPAQVDWLVHSGCVENACKQDYAPNRGWAQHSLEN